MARYRPPCAILAVVNGEPTDGRQLHLHRAVVPIMVTEGAIVVLVGRNDASRKTVEMDNWMR